MPEFDQGKRDFLFKRIPQGVGLILMLSVPDGLRRIAQNSAVPSPTPLLESVEELMDSPILEPMADNDLRRVVADRDDDPAIEVQPSHQGGSRWRMANKEIWRALALWYPFSEQIAKKHGIPRLHDRGGALDSYDQIVSRITGKPSDARGWEEDFVNTQLRQHPTWASWMGHCHGLANAQAIDKQPPATRRVAESISVDWSDRVGILVAHHSGDAAMRHTTDKATIRSFLEFFQRTGRPFVANIPYLPNGRREAGRWFRVIDGISEDRAWVSATDLRYGRRMFSAALIESMHMPIHQPGTPTKYQELTKNWINPWVKDAYVKHIVYGEPL